MFDYLCNYNGKISPFICHFIFINWFLFPLPRAMAAEAEAAREARAKVIAAEGEQKASR